ncbi:hypothetical protein PI124_g12776 [Phytophthora idaei]|nr:hypothetical protein PI124_g12776 [Phytophthora idaei]
MEGDNTLLLLQVYCKNACPELAEHGYAKVDFSNPDRLAKADRARSLLYQHRGDGREHGSGKRAQSTNERTERKPKYRGPSEQIPFSQRQDEGAEGNAAMAAKCYDCGDPKNKFTNCPFMIKAKQFASVNAVATCDNSGDAVDEADSSDGGDVWMTMAPTARPNNPLD